MEVAGTSSLVMKAVLLSGRWAGRSRRLGLAQASRASEGDSGFGGREPLPNGQRTLRDGAGAAFGARRRADEPGELFVVLFQPLGLAEERPDQPSFGYPKGRISRDEARSHCCETRSRPMMISRPPLMTSIAR